MRLADVDPSGGVRPISVTVHGKFVYVLNGWVEPEFEGGEMLRCEPGDTVYIPSGVTVTHSSGTSPIPILKATLGSAPMVAVE